MTVQSAPASIRNLNIISTIVRAIFGLSLGIKSTVQGALSALSPLFKGTSDGPWGSLKASPGD